MIARHGTLVVWATLCACVVVCVIVAALSKGRLPGLGPLVRKITVSPVGRGVLVLAWMWLGWHAFAR
jgi:Family of unknown function (DUF6186)